MNGRADKKLQRTLIARHGTARHWIAGHGQLDASPSPQVGRMERLSTQALGMRRSPRRPATVLFVALSVFLCVFAIFGHDGIVAYQRKQQQAQQLHRQILNLQKQNERLALHDQRLKNDRDTIEYEAREQMHYTRPGEVIYTLPQAPAATAHK